MKFEFTNYIITIDYNLSFDSAVDLGLPDSTDYCNVTIYDKSLDREYELGDTYYDILQELHIESKKLLGEVAQICCTIGDYAYKKLVKIANQYLHLDYELRHKAMVDDGLAVVVHKYNQMKKLEIIFDSFYNYYITAKIQEDVS